MDSNRQGFGKLCDSVITVTPMAFVGESYLQNQSTIFFSTGLTIILLVHNGHFSPVEKPDYILEGRVQETLRRIEVDGELLTIRFQVQSGLHVWDIKSFAYGLDMGTQQGVRGTEQGLDTVLQLTTHWGKKRNRIYVRRKYIIQSMLGKNIPYILRQAEIYLSIYVRQ